MVTFVVYRDCCHTVLPQEVTAVPPQAGVPADTGGCLLGKRLPPVQDMPNIVPDSIAEFTNLDLAALAQGVAHAAG